MIIAIGSADIHQLIQIQQEEKKGEKKKMFFSVVRTPRI